MTVVYSPVQSAAHLEGEWGKSWCSVISSENVWCCCKVVSFQRHSAPAKWLCDAVMQGRPWNNQGSGGKWSGLLYRRLWPTNCELAITQELARTSIWNYESWRGNLKTQAAHLAASNGKISILDYLLCLVTILCIKPKKVLWFLNWAVAGRKEKLR
jgi:hypothetical protein